MAKWLRLVAAFCVLLVAAGAAPTVSDSPSGTVLAASASDELKAEIEKKVNEDLRSRRDGSLECSGHGARDDETERCRCHDGFLGPTCSYKPNPARPHGHYVGKLDCEHGVRLGPYNCKCDAGWEGLHCHRRACVHGKPRCRDGAKLCLVPVCACDEGWSGPACRLPRKPCEPKDCKNGHFNDKACACECEAPFRGELCDECIPKDCPGNLVQDKETCGCTCPADLHCAHGGFVDVDSCTCKCEAPWSGESCETCKPQKCAHDGLWNSETCQCDCLPPWSSEDNCASCPPLDCQHGGDFQPGACACDCKGLWTGEMCDECPTVEELAFNGVDCGGRGFDRNACKCRDSCEPLDCLHGGEQDPDTCKCVCNGGASKPASTGATGVAALEDEDGDDQEASLAADDEEEQAFLSMHSGVSAASSLSASLAGKRAAATAALLAAAGGDGDAAAADLTYWAGDSCELCRPPQPKPCPGARPFDYKRCACSDSCPAADCRNGGQQNPDTCECDCVAPWAGKSCNKLADGSNADMAAASCKAVQDANPDAADGMYWINPTGVAGRSFQVRCDMSTNAGGWIELASIGRALSAAKLTAATYRDGVGGVKDGEYVQPCALFNGLDGSKGELTNAMIRVTMGRVKDYFRPIPGATLCEMLASHDKHLWSPNNGLSPDEVEAAAEEAETEAADKKEVDGLADSGAETTADGESKVVSDGEQPADAVEELLQLSADGDDDLAAEAEAAAAEAAEAEAAAEAAEEAEAEASADGAAAAEEAEEAGQAWLKPEYVSDPKLAALLGGSAKGWPDQLDGREFLSFWGGDRGGCCNYASETYGDDADDGSWGRQFKLHLKELPVAGSGREDGVATLQGVADDEGEL
eukprot:PLAT3087.1.p1 GENE.PLAT3087.1~~PLAT3087.1.p1  ORF type:complete len:869 (-),score=402.62 PLAT3087.1:64-2670(-)